MMADAVEQRGAEFAACLGRAHWLIATLGISVHSRDRMITLRLVRAQPVHEHRRSSGKRANRAVHRERLWHAAEEIESHRASGVRLLRRAAAGHQRLDLARELKGPTVVGVEERFDAVGVAREDQGATLGVPDRESK